MSRQTKEFQRGVKAALDVFVEYEEESMQCIHDQISDLITNEHIPDVSKMVTDTQRIDFIASTEQNICELSMPGWIVETNLSSLRDAIDACIDQHKSEQ
jgi:hypothetical protein